MRTPLPLAAVLLLVALAPASVAAQAGLASADVREVRAYRLTMPKLRQLNEVLTELHRLEQADPARQQLLQKQRELAALQEKDELTDADVARMARLEEEIAELEAAEDDADVEPSIDAVVARLEGTPAVAAALKRAGLSARETVVMQFALFQAGFTAEMLESGTISTIPPDANAENVKFYQANRAAITAMTALVDRDKE